MDCCDFCCGLLYAPCVLCLHWCLQEAITLNSLCCYDCPGAFLPVQRLLSVLAAAVAAGAKTRDFFSPSQLAAAISALAHFDLYHEAALYTVCGVASATAMHWPRDAVISLLASLNRLEFRHDRFLRAAANALAAEGAAPPRHMLQADGNLDYLASSLAALLQLGCEAPALEDVLTGILR